jgi:hypothetical protein
LFALGRRGHSHLNRSEQGAAGIRNLPAIGVAQYERMLDVAWHTMQFSSIHDLPSSLNDDPCELNVSFSGDYSVSVRLRRNARA